MRGRRFPIVAILLIGLVTFAHAPVVNAAPAPPHIVVVMADDLDDLSLQILLSAGLLPNIKNNIVNRGVRFSNAFSTNPLCAPSRATMLTGQYSHNHRVLSNEHPDGGVAQLDDSAVLATALQPIFRTGHVGKYLNHYGDLTTAVTNTVNPSAVNPAYVPPGWDAWYGLIDPTTYAMYNYQMNVNGRAEPHGGAPEDYQTTVLASKATSFITDSLAAGKPLFLNLAPLAPHFEVWSLGLASYRGLSPDSYGMLFNFIARPDPRQQTSKPGAWTLVASQLPFYHSLKPSWNEADVSDKPFAMQHPLMSADDKNWANVQYRTRMLTMLSIDDMVGSIAAALGSQLSNTVWVFTADNGFLLGEHRMSEKMSAYEESARIPLYIAGPGITGWPRTVSALVLNNDFAPTLAELGGVGMSVLVDGRSLVPFLQGTAPSDWRRRALIEHSSCSWFFDVPTYAAVRTGPNDTYPSRLYVESENGSIELYDLTKDPYEMTSVHNDPSRTAEIGTLREALAALKTCGGGSCQTLER